MTEWSGSHARQKKIHSSLNLNEVVGTKRSFQKSTKRQVAKNNIYSNNNIGYRRFVHSGYYVFKEMADPFLQQGKLIPQKPTIHRTYFLLLFDYGPIVTIVEKAWIPGRG